MNIPKGYKLVPVETLKFALGLTRHGFKNRTDQEADKYAALKTITELLEAPTPPQPIYDEEAKRELFEAYCAKVGLPVDIIPSGEYLIPATRFMSQGWHAHAKSVEETP